MIVVVVVSFKVDKSLEKRAKTYPIKFFIPLFYGKNRLVLGKNTLKTEVFAFILMTTPRFLPHSAAFGTQVFNNFLQWHQV
jgi:hypothetical protein